MSVIPQERSGQTDLSEEDPLLLIENKTLRDMGGTMLRDSVEAGGLSEFSQTSRISREAIQPAEAQSLQQLLAQQEKPVSLAQKIKFHGLGENDSAYNVSDKFMVEVGETKIPHMLVRVEHRSADKKFTSRLTVWRCNADATECWPASITNLPELIEGKITEDPSIAFVKGQPVISWVEVTPPYGPGNPTKDTVWKSVACTGPSLGALERFVDSEEGVKGLRFVEMADGRIGVSTRPDLGGRKKICFGVANSWEDITTEFLSKLKEVEGLSVDGAWGGFDPYELLAKDDIPREGTERVEPEAAWSPSNNDILPDEGIELDELDTEKMQKDEIEPDLKVWGGPNDLKLLPNGNLSMAMHLGWYEEKIDEETKKPIKYNRKYVAAHAIIKPPVGDEPARAEYLQVILTSDDIKNLNIIPRRPDLADVVYTGFILMERYDSPTCVLVVSAGDAEQIRIEIPNPLLKGWIKEYSSDAETSIR